MQARTGKENTIDEETKTIMPKNSLKVKTREFGRELTNTAAAKDKRSGKGLTSRGARAAKVPKPSGKINKLVEHSFQIDGEVTPFLKEIGYENLTADELKKKVKDEMMERKKKVRAQVPDYDMFRIRDTQEVADYVDEIFNDMKAKEKEFKIERDYAVDKKTSKSTITKQERATLIDFVEELHAVFDLIPETLFITIQTIDRYLGLSSDTISSIKDLQIIAVAAILTVSKYEDIIPPSLDELIRQMKKPTTRETVLLMETSILQKLGFELTLPTTLRFLERFSRISPKYNSAMDYAEFVIEVSNYNYDIIKEMTPSQIAAVALYIAGMATSGVSKWTKQLERATGVTQVQIKEFVKDHYINLPKKMKEELKVRNIFRKYQGYADGYPALGE